MDIIPKVTGLCLIAGTIALSGCASQRISGTLERYGLDTQRSECIGDSLASNLSTRQLLSLSNAAGAYKKNDTTPDILTMSDFVRVASEIRDPQVPIEVARATVQCKVLAADSIMIPPRR